MGGDQHRCQGGPGGGRQGQGTEGTGRGGGPALPQPLRQVAGRQKAEGEAAPKHRQQPGQRFRTQYPGDLANCAQGGLDLKAQHRQQQTGHQQQRRAGKEG